MTRNVISDINVSWCLSRQRVFWQVLPTFQSDTVPYFSACENKVDAERSFEVFVITCRTDTEEAHLKL
jgi:hypothetical protein